MRTVVCPVCEVAFVPYVRGDRVQVCCSKSCSGVYRRRPVRERFEEKVEKGPGCWLWKGATNGAGYGIMGPPGDRAAYDGPHNLYAHRVSYELYVAPIPAGHEIDHLCEHAEQGFGIREISDLTEIPEGTVGRYLAGWCRTVKLIPRPEKAAT